MNAAEIAHDWLLSQRSAQTEETYRRIIREWLDWCAASNLEPLAARRADVDSWRRYLRSPRRAGGALGEVSEAKSLAGLSSYYRYASEEHDVEHNPVARVKRPKLEHLSRRPYLLLPEARAVLAASRSAGPRPAALVHLLLATGARVSEVCEADVSDLGWSDDGHRALTVVRKGGRRGTLPILPAYWVVIEEYLNGRRQGPAGPLLATTHGRMTRQTAYRIVNVVARSVVPTKRIGPHSLRHTAATLALDDGVPIQEVQGMLGHSDSRTTGRYDRHGARRGGPAFQAVGDLLGEVDRG